MGVTKEIITPGDGTSFPQAGQTCKMHYTGTLTNGSKFDSSLDRGKPFEFQVSGNTIRPRILKHVTACFDSVLAICVQVGQGKVIKGWDEAVPQMSKGEKARLTCTPDYAYGARGFPPVIPENATLIFEVELLDFF